MPYKSASARRAHTNRYRDENREDFREKNRARAAKRWGLLEFRHVELPSDALFEEIWSAAKINVFHLSSEEIADWASARPVILQDELLLFGVASVLKILRRNCTAASPAAIRRANETSKRLGSERIKATIAKAEQFSRIVEMLDAHRVGDKQLGDCTKGDLLRAAADAEAMAGEATMNAQFYRLMAGLLPEHGVTVRQANNRKEVVALLTLTFSEESDP